MRHNDTHGGTSMNPFSTSRRPGRAGRVHRACGRALSATRSGSRRGSALLLVIGALALISVFAAIYVTIGQGDQRATTAQEQNRRVEAFGPVYGDYIAQIIADDRLDTMLRLAFEEGGGPVSGGWPGGQNPSSDLRQAIYRENTDRPSTDWWVRSIPSRVPAALAGNTAANQQRLAFNATGTHAAPWFVNGNTIDQVLDAYRVDRRVASDPWLASTAPTYLGAGTDRFSIDQGFGEKQLIRYLDDRDWAHISNLSPDGMFVNLYNLRGNAGGFDAEPGYTIGGNPADEDRRMSDGLTLLRKQGPGETPLLAMDIRTSGFWVPGVDAPVAWDFTLGDPENVPALWSTNQRFMLMPMDQSFFSYDRNGVIADWSSPDYPAYQYADADGDGLADSRWFELTDSSESGVGNNQLSYRFLAPAEGYRLFAAARVVDLSALVNLNVATDGMVGPTGEAMYTPSSIDLRRVLTMQDFGRELRDWRVPGAKGLALGGIKRDGRLPRNLADGDTFAYYGQYKLNSGLGAPTDLPDASEDWNAINIGAFAEDAIALAIDTESSLTAGDVGRLGGPSALRVESRFDFNDNMYNEQALRQLMYAQRIGGIDPTDPVARGGTDLGAGLFGLSDLAEMLTFWGVNDDEVETRLEQVIFGRYDDANPNITQTARRFSPLLPGRPTELDRRRHDTLSSTGDPARPAETDGVVDPDSMALITLSPRRALTTFSGAAPIFSSRLDPAALDTLSDSETPELVHDFIDGLSDGSTSVRDVFELYATTLASSAQIDDAWNPSMPEFRTMFYGRQGPELALTLSAFLTANLIDAYDDDSEPTPISVLATSSNTALETEFDERNQTGGAFPWPDGQKIRLSGVGGGMGVPQTRESDVSRLAYTVYGAEAYPVLTEVSSVVILTDASMSAGGDNEASGGGPPWQPADGSGSGGTNPITIRTEDWDIPDAWNMNEDLALVAFAFQLTNPFDQVINLGSETRGDGDVLDDDEYVYYLEFNGRMFKVCDFDENTGEYRNVTLAPGEARTFYVVANDSPDALGDIASKWSDLLRAYFPAQSVDEAEVVEWLGRQFNVGSSPDGPARVREFDPTTGVPEGFSPTGYTNVLSATSTPLYGQTSRIDDREVRLWRRMPLRTASGQVAAGYTPEHDLLVDRLTEPQAVGRPSWSDGSATLDPVPATITSDEVAGTVAGTEASANGAIAGTNHNSGFTMAFYGTIRRGDHPSTNPVQTGGETGRGVLPGWMIQSDTNTTLSDRSVPPRGNGSKLRRTDFDLSRDFAFESFRDFLDPDGADGVGAAVETIARHPQFKRNASGPTRLIDRTIDGDPYYGVATTPDQVVVNPELYGRDKDIETSITDPYTSASTQVSLVSVSDLLMVPAVGWIEEPDPVDARNFDPDQWVTFGEALGHALGISPALAASAAAPDSDPLLFLVDRTTTTPRYALDRLNLRLDDFVSFYDEDGDGIYRASAGSRDAVVGSGLPMALDLLSRFRRFGAEDAGDSLTTKVMGRINLNTATAQTLRSVPLLSPSLETRPDGRREFWGFDPQSPGAVTSDIGLPDLDAFGTTPDVAAHLIAYRDRRPAAYRNSSFDYSLVDITQPGAAPFEYRRLDETGAAWSVTDLAGVLTSNEGLASITNPSGRGELGRTVLTGIEGLREQLGYTSPSEVMAAVVDPKLDLSTLLPGVTIDDIRQNLPTVIGQDVDSSGDPRNVDARAAGSTAVTTDRQLYGTQTDQVANDYEEQLAVLNSVLATTDVRSDTFAVWFVVHGYQEGDVADLRDDDPLVPSFARRFLMIVDRSNVTERGQRPRILMLREVPL